MDCLQMILSNYARECVTDTMLYRIGHHMHAATLWSSNILSSLLFLAQVEVVILFVIDIH